MTVPATAAVPLLVWLKLLLSLAGKWIRWQELLLGGVIVVVIRWWFRPRPRLPPGPPPRPLVGNLPEVHASAGRTPVYVKFDDWSQLYGSLITIYIGFRPLVIVSSVTVVEEMLEKTTSEIQEWPWSNHSLKADQRKEREPLSETLHRLTSRVIRKFLKNGKFQECVTSSLDSVIARIRSKNNQPFDPDPLVTYLSFDVMYNLCFAQRFQPEDPEFQAIIRTHLALNALVTESYMQNLTSFPRLFESECLRQKNSLCQQFLKFVETEIKTRASSFDDLDKATDLAGYILQARSMWFDDNRPPTSRRKTSAVLTDEHVALFLSDILRAGTDYSRLILSWTLLYLATKPDVQKKCQHEIDVLLDGHAPDIEDCNRLPYTEAVLLEVMRIQPCMPLGTPYTATNKTTLGGYDIPHGTEILVNHWSLNMDPSIWTDPENFRPERFLDDKGKVIVRPRGWSPLPDGRWSTRGEDVSHLQLMLVISSLLHNFTITMHGDDEPDLEPQDGCLWSAPKPYQVKCTPRDKRHVSVSWQSESVDCSHSDPSARSLGFSSYNDDDQLRISALRNLVGTEIDDTPIDSDNDSVDSSGSGSTAESRSTCVSASWSENETVLEWDYRNGRTNRARSASESAFVYRRDHSDDAWSAALRTWTNTVT